MNTGKELTTKESTISKRFVEKVQQEFVSAVGSSAGFDDHEKSLATNFYIHADNVLKDFEAKRQDKNQNNKSPYKWENVNLTKLAIDAVHRIRVGLDALIPNHIHLVPYWNKNTGKYDLDIRMGYVGKLFVAQQFSLNPIEDITIHLVHEHDDFKAIMKKGLESQDSYEFDIVKPFDRGKIIGGFVYIEYEEGKNNKLVLVTEEEFVQFKNEAKSNAFWGKWGKQMRYKTLAHRGSEAVTIDPRKVHGSYHQVQKDDDPFKEDLDASKEVKIDFEEEAPKQVEERKQDISESINGANTLDFEEAPHPAGEQNNTPEIKDLNEAALGTAFE